MGEPFVIDLAIERQRNRPARVSISKTVRGGVLVEVFQPALGLHLEWCFDSKSAAQMGRMLLRSAGEAQP
jgi:hypothetical protein